MSATAVKVAFRVVLVTVLFTMLGFALGGFLGVVSISVLRAAAIPMNMQDALWFGAAPGGVVGCVAGLVIISISEVKSKKSEIRTQFTTETRRHGEK